MINHKLYYEIWKKRKGDPKYCFPLNMFLGVNGLIVNHPLVGKTFVQIESGVDFIVQNVYAHYYKGWYFFALTINKEQSSAGIYWNINSETDIENIEQYRLKDFEYNFETKTF